MVVGIVHLVSSGSCALTDLWHLAKHALAELYKNEANYALQSSWEVSLAAAAEFSGNCAIYVNFIRTVSTTNASTPTVLLQSIVKSGYFRQK